MAHGENRGEPERSGRLARYVFPFRDLDAEALALWRRAAGAADRIEQSGVVRAQLIDSVEMAAVLPYHLWAVARDLARLTALRSRQRAILQGVDTHDPDIAVVLEPQRRAQVDAEAGVGERVRALEAFGRLAGEADAARRRADAVRKLVTLNESHLGLLAEQDPGGNSLDSAGRAAQDLAAVIRQASEATRRANEAGRALMLPAGQDQAPPA